MLVRVRPGGPAVDITPEGRAQLARDFGVEDAQFMVRRITDGTYADAKYLAYYLDRYFQAARTAELDVAPDKDELRHR